MRLTLRTLLSYLDDTLDPAQAKAIGQKIAENPNAQELITRIKEVVRRRRLTTPPASGPGGAVDPNTVAEYIDNVLPSEKTAEVEEIALGSDVHLAEVAACHQILTVVLSEPAPVPPTARRRMYGLIQSRQQHVQPAASSHVAANALYQDAEENQEVDEALRMGLPLYRQQGAWFRWLAPLGAVIILAVVLVGVAIWQAVPASRRARASADAKLAKATPTQHEEPPAPAPPPIADTGKTKPIAEGNSAVKEKPEPKPAAGSTNEATPNAPSPPAPAPAPSPVNMVTPAAPPSTNRVAAGKFLIPVAGTPSVLLHRQSQKGSWQRVRPDSTIYTADTLMSLPGYRPELRLEHGVGLTLWGNLPDGVNGLFVLESAVRIHENADFDLDLTLDHGRIAITNQKPEGAVRARVRFNDKSWSEVWELTLQEPGTEVAMELWSIFPPGIAFKDPEGPLAGLGLFVLKGQANLKVRYETYPMKEPPGPALFVWNNVGSTERGPRHMEKDKMPSWTAKQGPRGKDAAKLNQALETLSTKLSKGAIDVVLPEMVREAEPYLRILGVFCLGATDNLAPLWDALSDESHPEVRLVAIDTLRHWMSLKADHDLKLYQAAESKFKPGPAEIIMTLLHSYSEQQRQEPETYETLISYLKNSKLAIRELAFTHLAILVPEVSKQIPYNPAGSSEQRERAYDLWKKAIPDGKLPAKPDAKGPPKPGIK